MTENNKNNGAIELITPTAIQGFQSPDWMTIGETLIKAFVASLARSPQTKRSYQYGARHLFEYLAQSKAIHCAAFEVARWYEHLSGNGAKPATISAYMQAAGRVIEWGRIQAQTADDMSINGVNAKQYGLLFPGRPFADKPKIERQKGHKRAGLTTAETDAFLGWFESNAKERTGRRNRAIAYLMNELGLRCVEITRLKLRDVAIEGRNLRVGITHKGHQTPAPKYIDLNFLASQYLTSWIDERRKKDNAAPDDFVFVSLSPRTKDTSKPLTTRTIENICVTALKAIGVKCEMITTHSIRHSFATQALEAVPLDERMQAAREIQDTMGHSTLDITLENYAHDIDARESRIRHIRESQRLERLHQLNSETLSTEPKRGRGRPKGSKNKKHKRKARKTRG